MDVSKLVEQKPTRTPIPIIRFNQLMWDGKGYTNKPDLVQRLLGEPVIVTQDLDYVRKNEGLYLVNNARVSYNGHHAVCEGEWSTQARIIVPEMVRTFSLLISGEPEGESYLLIQNTGTWVLHQYRLLDYGESIK